MESSGKFLSKAIINSIFLITSLFFALISFYIVFPAINGILWNKYDIMNKAWVRIMDLQMAGINIFTLPYFSELHTTLMHVRSSNLLIWYNETIVDKRSPR